MANDIEIVVTGDSDDAEHALGDLDRALALLEAMVEQVQKRLDDFGIAPGTVAALVANAGLMSRALSELEDQANDTWRALLGPTTLTSAAITGRVMLGDRGPAFPLAQGGAPGVGMVPYVPPQRFYQDRVFAMHGQYAEAQKGTDNVWRMSARNMDEAAGKLEDAADTLLLTAREGGGSAGGGGPGFISGLLAAAGMGGGGMHIGGLGFGPWWMRRGFGIPGARIGSVLGLMGFGAERFLGTGLGITGSLAGAGIGAGLYGAGMLGTMAVGMGTDMAGIGQAGGDIKTVSTDLTNLSNAVAQYGKNSQQAAAAQAQLNLDLSSFSPVARRAVLNAAQTTQQFHKMFDYFTGPAERVGAQIINQGTQTGEKFLPTIGRFAFGNMKIIQQGLQPFFDWMKQTRTSTGEMGGLGIFTDLEQQFQKRLPTAVHAGTQAFEVFMHVIDDASHHTGGFLTNIDKFFTRLNTPSGLSALNTEVGKMIALFKAWADLLISLGHMIFDLFRPAVSLGKDFAQQMTKVVDMTRQWLELGSTQSVLHNLFEAHKEQLNAIFQVLRSLLPVLYAAVGAFAQIETVVTKLTVGPLKMLANLIKDITSHPLADKILGWAAALVVVDKGLGSMIGWLDRLIAKWVLAGTAAEESAATTDAALASEDASLATTTTATGALGKAITALGGESILARLAALRASFVTLLGPIAVAAAAVYGLDKAIAKLTGFDALNRAWGSAGFGADNTAKDTVRGKNPYPMGTSDWFEWQAGFQGVGAGQHRIGNEHGNVDTRNKAYKQGAAAAATQQKKHKTAPDGSPVDWHQFVGHHAGEDCSLFTQRVYREVWGISIPRTSEEQFHGGMAASGVDVGDLLFYNGYNEFKPPGHVALYIGNGNLIQDNGSGTVQIMSTSALDSLGYMGARTYLKRSAISTSGTAGQPGFNPGGTGMRVGSTRVPGAHGAQPNHPALASRSSIFSALTSAQSGIEQVNQALHESFAKLAGVTTRFSPDTLMGAHPLAAAQKHWDPLLKEWKKQLMGLEDELHKHGLTAKVEAEIRARIDRIKNHITQAFDAIKRAAQTQFQAATTAWQAFTQAFDQNYQSGATTASDQLLAAQTKLGQLRQAVAIDQAQSKILGGKADPSMAQNVINQMSQVLATPGGKAQPYTQQQIDNWLQLWGEYYASKGYTPQQMYTAFNKLLKSVGLPEIDNPFDTGGLPLPPDARGTIGAAGTDPTNPDDVKQQYLGAHGGAQGYGSSTAAQHQHQRKLAQHHASHQKPRHHVQVHAHHHGHHPAQHHRHLADAGSGAPQVHVEMRFEKGLEWLDKHVKVLVDGQLTRQGRAANARARSRRH